MLVITRLLMLCRGTPYCIKFNRMNDMDLELDDHFYNTMVPILKDYVSRFTREHNTSLA